MASSDSKDGGQAVGSDNESSGGGLGEPGWATEDESVPVEEQDELESLPPPPPLYVAPVDLDVEDVENYQLGGMHPVEYGDMLGGRFEVIAKLGHGGFATVWLCLDWTTNTAYHKDTTSKWRAVKVIRADASLEMDSAYPELAMKQYLEGPRGLTQADWEAHHVSLPLEYFRIEGPNGTHLCQVSDVHGPSIAERWEARMSEDRAALLKNLLYGAGEALAFLHAHGACHGDVTPGNVLLRSADLSMLSRGEMLALLEERRSEPLLDADTKTQTSGLHAPRYIYEPADLSNLPLRDDPVLIDFGGGFRTANPPDEPLVMMPYEYGSPEAFIGGTMGPYVDVWAFACSIVNVLTRSTLFSSEGMHVPAYYEAILGPLPEDFRKSLEGLPADDLKALADDAHDNMKAIMEETGHDDPILAWVAKRRAFVEHEKDPETGDLKAKEIVQELPEEEALLLTDLLKQVFKYDPEERIDMKAVLAHKFFEGRAGPKAPEATLFDLLTSGPSAASDGPQKDARKEGESGSSSPFNEEPSDNEDAPEPLKKPDPSPLANNKTSSNTSSRSRDSSSSKQDPPPGTESEETPEVAPEAPDAAPEAPEATPEAPETAPEAPPVATHNARPDTGGVGRAILDKLRRAGRPVESARQSVAKHLRYCHTWSPTGEECLLVLIALVAGTLLCSVLLFFFAPPGWPYSPAPPPHCHRDSLVVPLSLKSSTSSYFRGLLVYSVPQEEQVVNGTCSCLAARGMS